MSTNDELLERLRERARTNTYWSRMGVEAVEAGEGYAKLRLPVRDELRNAPGAPVHGGVISFLVDAAVGGALGSLHDNAGGGVGQATLDLNVSFLGAARSGAIIAEGRILKRGGSIAFGEAELRDEAGDLIAKGRVTYMILRPRT
jgi:uncharacterized protein (TIGR00369 family)